MPVEKELKEIFDQLLSPEVWEEVGGGAYKGFSTRKRLRKQVVKRACEQGLTGDEFRTKLQREVDELKRVMK